MGAHLERRETDMQVTRVRLLCALLLCGVTAASALCAQEASGAGGNTNQGEVQQAKSAKPAKAKPAKKAKPGNLTPLYTVPKSEPWWRGGGPGPAGAGVK
jgi:nitrous oxide reductase